MTPGFDISHTDGEHGFTIAQFAEAFAAGYRFVIAKCSEGTAMRDPAFEANVRNAHAAGLVVSSYHFGRADEDGASQAGNALCAINKVAPRPGVTPLIQLLGGVVAGVAIPKHFFDLEDESGHASWADIDHDVRIKRVGNYLIAVDRLIGFAQCGIYTSQAWFNEHFARADWSHRALWMARYGVTTPGTTGAWKSPTIWQSSESGHVPGIGNAIDLNVVGF